MANPNAVAIIKNLIDEIENLFDDLTPEKQSEYLDGLKITMNAAPEASRWIYESLFGLLNESKKEKKENV